MQIFFWRGIGMPDKRMPALGGGHDFVQWAFVLLSSRLCHTIRFAHYIATFRRSISKGTLYRPFHHPSLRSDYIATVRVHNVLSCLSFHFILPRFTRIILRPLGHIMGGASLCAGIAHQVDIIIHKPSLQIRVGQLTGFHVASCLPFPQH